MSVAKGEEKSSHLGNQNTDLRLIALNIALVLGLDPMAFVYAVIFGASCSFASPIGYQTNLLVMAPGHYRFADFMRAGTPLIFVLWITFSLFAPWYYNLTLLIP